MRLTALISIVILASVMAMAQQPATAPAEQQAMASPIPDGTVINVELKKDLDTKKAKVGEKVPLEATDNVKDSSGKVIIPRKTAFTAVLTAADSSNKGEARLAFFVTQAVLPGGETFPMTAIMVGHIKPLKPLGGSISMASGNQAEATMGEMGVGNTSLAGVTMKPDPKLGSVLVSRKNFELDRGTTFDIRQVKPAEPAGPAK